MKKRAFLLSVFFLVLTIAVMSCSSDNDDNGGSGADFDASLYYSKTDLDGGQLDTRYYTETEIDSNYYTTTEVDDLIPAVGNATLFLDGYDSSGVAATHGWDTRTDDHSAGTSSPYAGWVVPANARYCLFQVMINNCTATSNVTITWAVDDSTALQNLTIHADLFKSSTVTCMVPVTLYQTQTIFAYIGMGMDPGITYTNPIEITPVAYFK